MIAAHWDKSTCNGVADYFIVSNYQSPDVQHPIHINRIRKINVPTEYAVHIGRPTLKLVLFRYIISFDVHSSSLYLRYIQSKENDP